MKHSALILAVAAEQATILNCVHTIALRVNPDVRTYTVTVTLEYGGPNGSRDSASATLVESELEIPTPRPVVVTAITQILLKLESALFAGAGS